ncbi:MAG: DNA gyrase inhibitor YacG [Planctomycetota bacterium]
MKYRCPICNKLIASLSGDKAKKVNYFPFCSLRCKLLDLGAWLDSHYRIVSKTSSEVEKPHDSADN